MFALFTADTKTVTPMSRLMALIMVNDRTNYGKTFNGYEAVIYVAM